jgi:hypothetical protein
VAARTPVDPERGTTNAASRGRLALALGYTGETRRERVTFRGLITIAGNRSRSARKLLILNGEMSEWLKEHAWKSEGGERHETTPKRLNAHAVSDLTPQSYLAICVRKPRCSSRFPAPRITVLSQTRSSLTSGVAALCIFTN